MKVFAIACALGLGIVTAAVAMCPYTTVFTQYGAGCSPVSLTAPVLNGSVNGSFVCGVTIDLNAPPVCCNVFLNGEWLLVGTSAVNVPIPNGCTLLASPDLVIPLPPQIGSTKIVADLPHDPALIGTSIYMQGVTSRFTTIGLTTDLEFSNGLELKFNP